MCLNIAIAFLLISLQIRMRNHRAAWIKKKLRKIHAIFIHIQFFSGIFYKYVIPITSIYFKFWLFFDNHLLLYIYESTRRDVPTITNALSIYIYKLYNLYYRSISICVDCGHNIILFYAYKTYCIPEVLEVNCYFCDLKRSHNNHIYRRNQVIWRFKFKRCFQVNLVLI